MALWYFLIYPDSQITHCIFPGIGESVPDLRFSRKSVPVQRHKDHHLVGFLSSSYGTRWIQAETLQDQD